MTALVVALAATCVTLGLLLVCALVGYSEVVDQLRTRLDRAEAENEDLTTELRHQARGSHPAGRGLDRQFRQVAELASVTGLDVAALREALTERDAEHEGGGGA